MYKPTLLVKDQLIITSITATAANCQQPQFVSQIDLGTLRISVFAASKPGAYYVLLHSLFSIESIFSILYGDVCFSVSKPQELQVASYLCFYRSCLCIISKNVNSKVVCHTKHHGSVLRMLNGLPWLHNPQTSMPWPMPFIII